MESLTVISSRRPCQVWRTILSLLSLVGNESSFFWQDLRVPLSATRLSNLWTIPLPLIRDLVEVPVGDCGQNTNAVKPPGLPWFPSWETQPPAKTFDRPDARKVPFHFWVSWVIKFVTLCGAFSAGHKVKKSEITGSSWMWLAPQKDCHRSSKERKTEEACSFIINQGIKDSRWLLLLTGWFAAAWPAVRSSVKRACWRGDEFRISHSALLSTALSRIVVSSVFCMDSMRLWLAIAAAASLAAMCQRSNSKPSRPK
jgi:hypothetical protein